MNFLRATAFMNIATYLPVIQVLKLSSFKRGMGILSFFNWESLVCNYIYDVDSNAAK